jgi:hypothetical protein
MTNGHLNDDREQDPPPTTPMGFLVIRFLLEIFAWAGLGVLGWHIGGGGVTGSALAILFIVISMAVWGVFRVRHDPPGKTDHPVIVPGWVRLVIEIGTFAIAAYGLWVGWNRASSETLMTAVVLLYGITYDRQRWLLRQ